MSLTLASIHVYPIKSLGGFAVEEARLSDRGLEHDRRWMLVDERGEFISQRGSATMAVLHCTAQGHGFSVRDLRDGSRLDLPWRMAAGTHRSVSVWSDNLQALPGKEEWSSWFSERLGRAVQLMYMPDTSIRRTDGRYAQSHTSLSDGFPYLITSQASLDDLNGRLKDPVGMERFRPNLVINGGHPFQEDNWQELRIGDVRFRLVKPCARCVVVTTEQRTGLRCREPLRTLATYRSKRNSILFGMNAVGDTEGLVRVNARVLPGPRP